MRNVTAEYQEVAAQGRALAILATLFRQPGYGSNEQVMGAWLDHLKIGVPRGKLRLELEKLSGYGLLVAELRGEANNLMVFWLTELGVDYLNFRTHIDGLPAIGPETQFY